MFPNRKTSLIVTIFDIAVQLMTNLYYEATPLCYMYIKQYVSRKRISSLILITSHGLVLSS